MTGAIDGIAAARGGGWRSLRRQAGIFAAYFTQFLKMRLAYRVDFAIDLFANLVQAGVQLVILAVLFARVPALRGWSYEQVLFIYGFSLLPLGLFNIVSTNLYRFGERYVIEGHFDRVLLRPINPLAQIMFEEFNLAGVNEIAVGIGVMAHAAARLGLAWSPLDLGLFLLLAASAAGIFTGIFLGLTSVSFWFEDRLGLAPPVYNIIRFSRYPLSIFSPLVRLFLTFVLPFAWVAFYPATWFVGGPEVRRLALLTPLVGAAVFGGAYVLWSRGVRRYASTGS
ncbi:MAG: ABC transporter permease [Candidatus Krumholzibacteriia bacterium]